MSLKTFCEKKFNKYTLSSIFRPPRLTASPSGQVFSLAPSRTLTLLSWFPTSEAESDLDPPLEALLPLVEPPPKKSRLILIKNFKFDQKCYLFVEKNFKNWFFFFRKKPRRNRPPKTLEMTIWDSVSSIKTARTLFINKLYASKICVLIAEFLNHQKNILWHWK